MIIMYQCSNCRKTFTKKSGTCPHCGVSFYDTKNVDKLLPTREEEAAIQRQKEKTKKTLSKIAWISPFIILIAVLSLNIRSCSIRQSQFYSAIEKGDIAEVEKLLAEGKKLNSVNWNLETPLMHSVKHNQIDMTKLLLKSKADVNFQFFRGKTALKIAVKNGDTGIVRVLLDGGADTELKNLLKRTVLMAAAKLDYTEIAEMLIDNGSDVNAKDLKNITALMLAAENGHIDVVRLLLQRGAKIDHKDCRDKTAREYALAKGHNNVIEVLDKEYNAKLNISSPHVQTKFSCILFRGLVGGFQYKGEFPSERNPIIAFLVYTIIHLIFAFLIMRIFDNIVFDINLFAVGSYKGRMVVHFLLSFIVLCVFFILCWGLTHWLLMLLAAVLPPALYLFFEK